jgi:hypothetical protein
MPLHTASDCPARLGSCRYFYWHAFSDHFDSALYERAYMENPDEQEIHL